MLSHNIAKGMHEILVHRMLARSEWSTWIIHEAQ